MNRAIREHLKRVLPEICEHGVTMTLSQAQLALESAVHIETAEVDGTVRAHAEIRRNATSPHRWTVSCAVEREYQGRGLGRRVLSAALRRADELGAEYVDGVAWADNHRVLALDLSLGFRVVGTVIDAYRRGGRSYDQVLLVRGGT